MKKRFCIFLASVLDFILFFSCTNSRDVELAFKSEETLKDITNSLDSKLIWTRELESVRLTSDLTKNGFASVSVKLNPESMSIMQTEEKLLYPVLDGFGSLDNSAVSSELAGFIDSFASNMMNFTFDKNQFEDEMFFEAVLFKNDFCKLYKNIFEKEFNIFPDEKAFDTYIIGEPYFDENQIELSLRFYMTDSYYMDTVLYISCEASYKINQLSLIQLCKINAK